MRAVPAAIPALLMLQRNPAASPACALPAPAAGRMYGVFKMRMIEVDDSSEIFIYNLLTFVACINEHTDPRAARPGVFSGTRRQRTRRTHGERLDFRKLFIDREKIALESSDLQM